MPLTVSSSPVAVEKARWWGESRCLHIQVPVGLSMPLGVFLSKAILRETIVFIISIISNLGEGLGQAKQTTQIQAVPV